MCLYAFFQVFQAFSGRVLSRRGFFLRKKHTPGFLEHALSGFGPFSSILGVLGCHWALFGHPWLALGALGSLWVPLGSVGSLWELNVHRLRCLSTKSSLLEHATGAMGAAGAAGAPEVVSRTAAWSPPPTRAGGQDDGSYTNSLKI